MQRAERLPDNGSCSPPIDDEPWTLRLSMVHPWVENPEKATDP